jgi:hypothetical protein
MISSLSPSLPSFMMISLLDFDTVLWMRAVAAVLAATVVVVVVVPFLLRPSGFGSKFICLLLTSVRN